MEIHISRGEDRSGPFTLEQVQDYLAQGRVLPDDLAWHKDLVGWIPLSQLMASIAAPVDPAPSQPVAITPEPVQSGPTIENAPVKVGDKKKLQIVVGACVAVLAIATAVWFFVIREKDSGTGNQQVVQQPQSKLTNNTTSPVDLGPDKPANKPGTVLWEFETGGGVNSSPALGADGILYVGSGDNKVYALNGKTGAKIWEFVTGGIVPSSPALGADGILYVGSFDKKIYALDRKTGTKKWEFVTGDSVASSPALGADGILYVGSHDDKVYALNGKTGAKIWEFVTGVAVFSSPALGADDILYVGSQDKKIYALDGKTGAKLWEFETGGIVPSSPALGADGTVFVGSFDKKLYALNGKTGTKLWEFETGGNVSSSPALGADGILYVGSRDKKVYAIKTDSKGPTKSPWPMFGQNAQHTGRAPKK